MAFGEGEQIESSNYQSAPTTYGTPQPYYQSGYPQPGFPQPASAPTVYGTPQPGYPQPATGIPLAQGYQQPLAGWPAYGAPMHGMPMMSPYSPYAYVPPPPGGAEDEKFQINDTGVVTIVPGLTLPKGQRALIFGASVTTLVGCFLVGMGIWLTMVVPAVGFMMFVFASVEFFILSILLIVHWRSRPTHHSNMAAEYIRQYIDRITAMEVTSPQIEAVRNYVSNADPNVPHEFYTWKTQCDARGRQRHRIIGAKFNCMNLAPGTRVQVHLYQLS